MIKSIGKITLVTILAATVLGMPVRVSAQDASQTKPAVPSAPAPKAKLTQFHGKLAEVDKTAKTITVGDKTKRTFTVSPEAKITKNGKVANLEDGVVGEPVSGSYTKSEDGKMVTKLIHFGAKSESEVKSASPAKP